MKILGIVILMALLLGGAVIPVAAAAPQVMISINAPDEAASGNDFTVDINISEVRNFDACNYDISFDASMLRLDNVTSGLIGSTKIPIDMYNEVNPGTCRVVQNVPGLVGISGSGYLAVLHFHVIASASGSSTISLSNGILANNLAEEITATWVGDSVRMATARAEETTQPAVNPTPEVLTLPTVVDSSPEATAPNEAAPLPIKPINWPVLWAVTGGVVVVGLIIFLLATRKA